MLLQEAIRIFEDFITSIKILQNSLTKEEIEITRNSIFKVVDALEVFALNYGKHQMIGANSSVEINSHKLCESQHDHFFGFKIVHYSLINLHNDQWHNGCSDDLILWDLLISAVGGWSWFIPPMNYLFLSIIVIVDDFFRRLEWFKALKPQLSDVLMIYRWLYFLEDYVINT